MTVFVCAMVYANDGGKPGELVAVSELEEREPVSYLLAPSVDATPGSLDCARAKDLRARGAV